MKNYFHLKFIGFLVNSFLRNFARSCLFKKSKDDTSMLAHDGEVVLFLNVFRWEQQISSKVLWSEGV